MTTPTTPPELLAVAEKIRQSLPGMARDFVGQRAAGMKVFTVEESFSWLENVVNAVTGSTRLPVTAESTREADGTLTIRITPTPPQ